MAKARCSKYLARLSDTEACALQGLKICLSYLPRTDRAAADAAGVLLNGVQYCAGFDTLLACLTHTLHWWAAALLVASLTLYKLVLRRGHRRGAAVAGGVL